MHRSGLRWIGSIGSKSLAIGTVTAILLALVFLSGAHKAGDAQADPTWPGLGNTHYEPTTSTRLCNTLPNASPFTDFGIGGDPGCVDADTTPNSSFDLTTSLNIPDNNLNFANFVTFLPSNVSVQSHAAIPPNDGETPVVAGGLVSQTFLGLLNSPCTNTVTVNFILYNVALPNDPSNPTNIAWPKEEGQENRFQAWVTGGMTRPETFADNPGAFTPVSGSPIALANNLAFTHFPSYLLRVLSPSFADGVGVEADAENYTLPSDFIMPTAVYGGITVVAGSHTPLYFVQLPAGSLQALPDRHPFKQFASAAGQPSITVLVDPTGVQAAPSPITDFCTPLESTTMLLGEIDGTDRIRTPATNDQTGRFRAYTQSMRDTSSDGIENALSLCATEQVDHSLRTAGQAAWIAACDSLDVYPPGHPNAGQPLSSADLDWDLDGFFNRQDNCEVDANDDQVESELTQTWAAAASDWGPKTDSIGDDCDTGSITVMQFGANVTITLSPEEANGHFHAKAFTTNKCFNRTGGVHPSGACASGSAANQAIAPGVGGATRTYPQGGTWSAFAEDWMGLDVAATCSGTTGVAGHPAWAPDMNNDRAVNILDMILVSGSFGSSISPDGTLVGNYLARRDVNADGFVNILDMILVSGSFGVTCTYGQQ